MVAPVLRGYMDREDESPRRHSKSTPLNIGLSPVKIERAS
jgi:hypothetical protein